MRPKPIIAPAILAYDFQEFEEQLSKLDGGNFPYIQVDVMDGIFVPEKSCREIDRISDLDFDCPLELHLMVNDPLKELEKWSVVNNIFRVIFHVESKINLDIAFNLAEDTEIETGIAINPNTELSEIEKYLNRVKMVQFMTVYPGKQGASLQEKVKEKIIDFSRRHQGIMIGVDGGVNAQNIKELHDIGVDIFTVGSALMRANDVNKAYLELKSKLA